MNPDDTTLDPTDEELVAAYALDALDADEAAQTEALLATSRMAAAFEARMRLAAAELAAASVGGVPGATDDGDGDGGGPDDLRTRVLDAARARRSPTPPHPTDDVVVHRIELQRLLTTLDELTGGDWTRPVDPPELAGFTVQDLAAHVAGSEATLAQQLGLDVGAVPETETDNERRTAEVLERHRRLDPAATVAELDRLATLVDAHVSSLDSEGLARTIEWWGMPMSIADVLLHRAFEIWVHHDDIRRATDVVQAPPPPGSLDTMSTKAASWTPLFLSTVGATVDGAVAVLDLTGPGGGRHVVPLGEAADPAGEPRFVLTCDVVDYCRAIGNRVPPGGITHAATGDTELAGQLVGALTNLAGL